jgi:uncharacterized glyoxalase superfamily protein PhnB
MKKLTPVLVVDAIEPCLEFWVGRLGWTKTVAVPQGDRLGFVILQSGAAELMYQTRESVRHDVPALAERDYHTALFVEVEDLEAVARAVEGAPRVFPLRETFYGSREIGVREPAGNAVTFACFAKA